MPPNIFLVILETFLSFLRTSNRLLGLRAIAFCCSQKNTEWMSKHAYCIVDIFGSMALTPTCAIRSTNNPRAQKCISNWRLKFRLQIPPYHPDMFSLRPCRSSSVTFFFLILGREIICGKFGGNFVGIFLTHTIKVQTTWGQFRSIFRENIRASNKIFCADFILQNCHPKAMNWNSWAQFRPPEIQMGGCTAIQTTSLVDFPSNAEWAVPQ